MSSLDDETREKIKNLLWETGVFDLLEHEKIIELSEAIESLLKEILWEDPDIRERMSRHLKNEATDRLNEELEKL